MGLILEADVRETRAAIGVTRAALCTLCCLLLAGASASCILGSRCLSESVSPQSAQGEATRLDWAMYGGDSTGDRYSPLAQIDRGNVSRLQVAWRFDAGADGGLQTNPLVIGRNVYVYTSSLKVVSLDGATGKQRWVFDAKVSANQPSRGFSYWSDGKQSILFAGIMDHLYALDPVTGKPIESFGEGGGIDLRKNLGDGDYTKNFAVLTTPGTIFKDSIIIGFRTSETQPAPHGDIRSYDVHTGKLRWSFHTVPHPDDPGYESWMKDSWKVTGAANNWAGMVVDEKRGILFVPTGSAVNDFYGADRVGDNLYANTLLALDAATGRRIWHFQGVHHDIWDRDFPSPPVLLTVKRDGKDIDAVAQTTKQGFVFLFERDSGRPLFPIREMPFPASNVPGEVASKTQPIPVLPEPFARQRLTEQMLTRRTPVAHAWAEEQFRSMRSDGPFVPFAVDKQTVIFPGFDGGAEWGGPAVDPRSSVLYVNSNDLPWTGGLSENKTSGNAGEAVYQKQCALCHREDRSGSPPAFPSLLGVNERRTSSEIEALIHNGKGRMPSYPNIQGEALTALMSYLKSGAPVMSVGTKSASTQSSSVERGASKTDIATQQPERTSKVEASSLAEGAEAKYHFTGYRKFLDPDGYPAVVPPWGTLNAIDLNTGRYLWKIPLGEYPELVSRGMKDTGSENYGGPIVTAGGVVIIAATIYDRKIRAFHSGTGELLWEAALPYAGTATPATYMIDGKQYIVIACSGLRDTKGPQGAAYIAFALP